VAKQAVGNERIYVYINGEKVEVGSSKYKAYIERMQSAPKKCDKAYLVDVAKNIANKLNTTYARTLSYSYGANVNSVYQFGAVGFITGIINGFYTDLNASFGGAKSNTENNVVPLDLTFSVSNVNNEVNDSKFYYWFPSTISVRTFDELFRNKTSTVKIDNRTADVKLPIFKSGDLILIKYSYAANRISHKRFFLGIYLGAGRVASAYNYGENDLGVHYRKAKKPYRPDLASQGVKIYLIEDLFNKQFPNNQGGELIELSKDTPTSANEFRLIPDYQTEDWLSFENAQNVLIDSIEILHPLNVDYSEGIKVPAKNLDDLKGNSGSTEYTGNVTEDKNILIKADYGNNEDKLLVKANELGRYQFVGYKGGDFPWKFVSQYSTTPSELYATGVDITKPYPSLDYKINSYTLENGNLDSDNFNRLDFNITNFIKTSSAYSINPSQQGDYKLTYTISREGISSVPNNSISNDFFNDNENIVLLNSDFVKSDSVKFINISKVDFLLFGPQQKPSGNLPLIVWFYGNGENKGDAKLLYGRGLANIIRNWNTQTNGKYLNCYVMCVRNPGNNPSYWTGQFPSNLYNCINSLKNTLPIATNKIILMGHSNGTCACGFHAWYDRQTSTPNPVGFSANIMISPYSPGGDGKWLNDFPTYVYKESAKNNAIDKAYKSLKEIYGTSNCETISDTNHGTIVGKVFNQLDNGVVKVLDWAFKQGVSETLSGPQIITGSIPAGGSYWSITNESNQELSKVSHLSLLGITISGDGTFWNEHDYITISIADNKDSYTVDETTLLNYFKNNNYLNGPSYIYNLTEVPFKAYVYNPFKETDVLVSKYALGIAGNNASESDVITCEFYGNSVLNTLEGVNTYYNTIYMSTKDLLEQINEQNIYITKEITQSNNVGSSSAVTEVAKIINHEWGSNNKINTLYMRGSANEKVPENISTLGIVPSNVIPQSNLGTGILQGLFMRFLVGAVVINTAQAQASQYDNWYDKVTHVKAATWGTYQTKYKYKTFDEDTAGKSDAYKGELLFIASCVVNGWFSLPSNICIYAEPSIAHKYIKKLLIANSAGLKPCIGVDRTPLTAFSSKDAHGNIIDVSAANLNTNDGILTYIKTLWQRAYDLYMANKDNFAQIYQSFKSGQPISITVPNS
jgi:hypothetical protein